MINCIIESYCLTLYFKYKAIHFPQKLL